MQCKCRYRYREIDLMVNKISACVRRNKKDLNAKVAQSSKKRRSYRRTVAK